MPLTKKQKRYFYKHPKKIKKVILNNARKRGHIIYGARAVNKQLPIYLQKHTEDYDIYSTTPKKTAKRVERKLDKKYGGNYFETKPALHPGTTKLINRVTKRGVADYSKPPEKIKIIKRKGVKYAHKSHQLGQIKKSLADKESKFRWDKDKETKQRIELAKLKEKKKRNYRKSLMKRTKKAFKLPKGSFKMPRIRSPI